MLYAIISDIHGNQEALEAVLTHIRRQRPDMLVCLGDVVGYGANPDECVKIIREQADVCLLGNHEATMIGLLDIGYFTQNARIAALWTRDQLSAESLKWLHKLPLTTMAGNDFTAVHSSLFQPEQFNYVQYTTDAYYNFMVMKKKILFIGHSHFPIVFFNTLPMSYTLETEIKLEENVKAIINVGSVGQPRDDNPCAAYMLYDSKKNKARLFRIEYNIQTAVQKIIAAKLPKHLGDRLFVGA